MEIQLEVFEFSEAARLGLADLIQEIAAKLKEALSEASIGPTNILTITISPSEVPGLESVPHKALTLMCRASSEEKLVGGFQLKYRELDLIAVLSHSGADQETRLMSNPRGEIFNALPTVILNLFEEAGLTVSAPWYRPPGPSATAT